MPRVLRDRLSLLLEKFRQMSGQHRAQLSEFRTKNRISWVWRTKLFAKQQESSRKSAMRRRVLLPETKNVDAKIVSRSAIQAISELIRELSQRADKVARAGRSVRLYLFFLIRVYPCSSVVT
jgi:hypothetical protein